MADINQRIKNISDFFAGMQVENIENENYIYVVVKLPQKWRVSYEDTINKFNVEIAPDETTPGQYYFIAKMEVGFDTVFDAIDFNIDRMKTIAERSQLLRQKITELQLIFENQEIPIESLRTLEFKYKQPKKKFPTPKKEIIEDINVEEENKSEIEQTEEENE